MDMQSTIAIVTAAAWGTGRAGALSRSERARRESGGRRNSQGRRPPRPMVLNRFQLTFSLVKSVGFG
jgi:hypothetical protein